MLRCENKFLLIDIPGIITDSSRLQGCSGPSEKKTWGRFKAISAELTNLPNQESRD